MKTPLYRQAIHHGWQLARFHVWLWPFGLFAAALGQMGLLEFITKVGFSSSTYVTYPNWLQLPALIYSFNWGGLVLPPDGWVWFFWLLIICIGFGVLFLIMSVASQGAIIHNAAAAADRQAFPDIGPSWHAGVSHFWRLLGIQVLKKAFFVALAVAVGWGTLNIIEQVSLSDTFLFLGIFILASFVGIVLSFLAVYAAGYVVVEEYSLVRSIESAWKLFLNHWLVSLEVGAIILLFNVLISLIVLVGMFIFLLPSVLLWFVAIVGFAENLFWFATVIGIILLTIFLLLIAAMFSVFTTSVWTFLFMKMHRHGVPSRVLGWLRRA